LVNKAVIEEADRRSNLEENTTALEIDQSAPADVAVQNRV
jgi:hypothetical protein